MDLYIAEKPSLAKAIAAALPGEKRSHPSHIVVGDAVVTWCFGHMLQQAEPEDYDERYAQWNLDDLPIAPTRWALKPIAKSSKQLTAIRKLLREASRIINAGDPDEEGQLLVDEILGHYGNTKPVMRVLVSDYNASKVKAALQAIAPNTDPQFAGWSRWALCRSRLDWLFGLNLTRAYTLRGRAQGYRGVLSVGRVQMPTLAIIVSRDRAIAAFKPAPFFTIAAAIGGETPFTAKWVPADNQSGLDAKGRLVDEAVELALTKRLNGADAHVVSCQRDAKHTDAPLPHSLESLQMAGNDAYGYTIAQVLEAAQSLYETHALTSYPRSGCRYLSTAQHAEAPERLQAAAATFPGLAPAVSSADPQQRSKAFDDAKTGAHHGIVPTAKKGSLGQLSEIEQRVYALIASAYVAQFLPAYRYEQTVIELDIAGERFRARGNRPLAQGWKLACEHTGDEDAGEPAAADEQQTMPLLEAGSRLPVRSVNSTRSLTTPPARFTEKLLVAAMRDVYKYVTDPAAQKRLKQGSADGRGIGTPATRATTIEELKRRGLILAKGKQLVSSPTAQALIDAVPPIATDAGFTGMTELALDMVAAGTLAPDEFLTRTHALVATLVDQARTASLNLPPEITYPCPKCAAGKLRRLKGPKGFFWGCDRYKDDCKATFPDKRGKPDTGATARPRRKTASKASGGGNGRAQEGRAPARRATASKSQERGA